MTCGRSWGVVVLGCLCVALLSGCRGLKGANKGGNEALDFDVLQGDAPLGQRFEDLERITDVELTAVMFDYDSFQIGDAEMAKIDAAAEYMRGHADAKLVLEGHCDERGSDEYNMALGEHRALAVRAHMVGLGIDGARIQTRSFGEEMPVDAGHSEASWCLNRRVEFALYR